MIVIVPSGLSVELSMPAPSAWDDRVRVCEIPSRHPCLRALALLAAFQERSRFNDSKRAAERGIAVVRRFFDLRSPVAGYISVPRPYVVLSRSNIRLVV